MVILGKISLIKNSVHWGIDFLKKPLATTVACKLMMTNDDDDDDDDDVDDDYDE